MGNKPGKEGKYGLLLTRMYFRFFSIVFLTEVTFAIGFH